MIIKLKSHKRPSSFQKVLDYMLHNQDRLFDKSKRSFAITHNLKGHNIDQWVQQLKENETYRQHRRSDSVLLTHEILSWHKDDAKHITLAKMEEMARQYIHQRNPKGMYVAVPHFDKDHYHLHICASGVEYRTGKSLRLSKLDLQKLKVDIQNYQKEKFPELSNSVVEHGKKGKSLLSEKEYQLKLRTGRETEKERLTAVLKTCYKKAGSREDFFQMLNECGIETYDRGGKITGVVSDGIKFRFNRLGYTEERLRYLDRSQHRGADLQGIRNLRSNVKKNVERADQVQLQQSMDNDLNSYAQNEFDGKQTSQQHGDDNKIGSEAKATNLRQDELEL